MSLGNPLLLKPQLQNGLRSKLNVCAKLDDKGAKELVFFIIFRYLKHAVFYIYNSIFKQYKILIS